MDSFRDLANELEPAFGSHPPEMSEVAISADERRLQVRAYNYWASLLDGRDFPSIEDLNPASVAEFAKNSVLLDFTAGPANPTTAYVGVALRRECDLDNDVESMEEVPEGSLLSRLTQYHDQILDSRAPVGIEADFVNQRGVGHCYRGILMPFSSDGDTIDFVYGVFSWSEHEVAQPAPVSVPAFDSTPHQPAAPDAVLVPNLPPLEVSDELGDEALELSAEMLDRSFDLRLEDQRFADVAPEPEPVPAAPPAEHIAWQDGPLADPDVLQAAGEATLADWLSAARATAEDAKAADGRSRHALYQALGLAYDFACAAIAAPDEYQALLEECGIVVQARAPMTAVAKLVFGANYDKARLTEYAAALSYAARQEIGSGGFLPFIDSYPGGLKGLVEAERRLRKPDGENGGWRESAISRLRTAEARPLDTLAGNGEFALVLVRREASGAVSPVAAVSDPALLDKALKRAAA
jgi:hypothetical protein